MVFWIEAPGVSPGLNPDMNRIGHFQAINIMGNNEQRIVFMQMGRLLDRIDGRLFRAMV